MINVEVDRASSSPSAPARTRLSAAEASARLGIKRETLYAYVSRGLLTRERASGVRGSTFDPVEVDRLAGRGRVPDRSGREVRIESAVTTIEGGRYYYRGRDPIALARKHTFEQVAEFLWTGELAKPPPWRPDPAGVTLGRAVQCVLPARTLAFDRVRVVVAALAGTDPFRHDLRREAVAGAARRLLATLVECLPRRRGGGREERRREPASFASRVWDRVSARPAAGRQLEALDGALVLLADHELAASTFAVRIAAAFRADPYGALGAGLGVLGGARHGAVSVAAEALLAEIEDAGDVAPVIDRYLRGGEKLPGIGHAIYPEGDQRARALLVLVREAARDAKRLGEVEAFLEAASKRGLPAPNVDLGIAALTHAFRLPRGTGELLFALARMSGWIAHAIEEYEQPSELRPRAVYTGSRPDPSRQRTS